MNVEKALKDMSDEELMQFDFTVIDHAGRGDGRDITARDIVDDAARSDLDGELIGATAAHAARIGNQDVDTLVELLNRDHWDGVLSGMPSDRHEGQRRKYTTADVLRVLKTARYRALARDHRDEQAAQTKRQARYEREQRDVAAKTKAELERQIALIPGVYTLLVDRIQELEAQIGLHSRAPGARSRLLD
jgi:hypothetical protein